MLGHEGDGYRGIVANNAVEDLIVMDTHVEGFDRGARVVPGGDAPFVFDTLRDEDENWYWDQFRIEGSSFADNVQDIYYDTGAIIDATHTGSQFARYVEIADTTFDEQEGNAAPEARFETVVENGVVRLDAAASVDPDKAQLLSGDPRGNGIASYAWDFDDDGTIDAFGRDAVAPVSAEGRTEVRLTVTDAQGAMGETAQAIEVPAEARADVLAGVGFLDAQFDTEIRPQEAGAWRGLGFGGGPDGASATPATDGDGTRGLAAAIESRGAHVGRGELTLDVTSRDGDGRANEIDVEVWGVDGLFGADPTEADPDLRIALYDADRRADVLLSETVTLEDGESSLDLGLDVGAEGYDWLMVRVSTDTGSVDIFGGDALTLRDASLVVTPGGDPRPAEPVVDVPQPEEPTAPVEIEEPPLAVEQSAPGSETSPIRRIEFDADAGQVLDVADFDVDSGGERTYDMVEIVFAGQQRIITDGEDLLAYADALENDGDGDDDTDVVVSGGDMMLRLGEASLTLRGVGDAFAKADLDAISVDYTDTLMG